MATRRVVRRDDVPGSTAAPVLPPDLAAGPDPARWSRPDEVDRDGWASRRWHQAGGEWSRANGYGSTGWRDLLAPDVRYAVSALGRARRHLANDGYRFPWEQA